MTVPKVNGWVTKAATPVALGVLATLVGWVLINVSEIKGNRFTSEHGQQVWKEIARIREDIAKLPPQRFMDRFTKLEDKMDDMVTELTALKAEVRLLRNK